MRLLLDLDQPGKGGEIESAWDEEIRARVKAVDEGRVSGIPYDQIKKEVTNRFIPPMIIEFLPQAKSELMDAVAYYEGELGGLGQRFWDEVDEHICNDSYCSDARSCSLAQLTPP